MKKVKIFLLILIILINSVFTTSCWNYKEIDDLSIVAGVAVDKGINSPFLITVELVQIIGGKDSKMVSKIISMEGKTMMDAVRNIISLSGKKLYWSHSKVIILSKDIACDSITKVIDWYNRDSEPRADINLLISEGKSAKEIFNGQSPTEDIKSYTLANIVKNQVNLDKALPTNILQIDMGLQDKSMSAAIPAVHLKQDNEKFVPQIMGTAVIKNDKLIGFLSGEETKALLFIINRVKGGVLTEEIQDKGEPTPVSLEIFNSKTRVTPAVEGKNISINLNIETTVGIDEVEASVNFSNEEVRKQIEENAEKTLKEEIETLVKKLQTEYDTDIFEFGTKLREEKVQVWKNVEDDWDEVFKTLTVNVNTSIHIKNSSLLAKPLKEGE